MLSSRVRSLAMAHGNTYRALARHAIRLVAVTPAVTPICHSTRRSISENVATAYVKTSLQNGIMDSDDYFRKGMPPAKYTLRAKSPDQLDHPDAPRTSAAELNEIFNQHRSVDPYALVAKDIRSISDSILEVVGSDHPLLTRIASYYFNVKGKRIRPAVVLLVSKAAAAVKPPQPSRAGSVASGATTSASPAATGAFSFSSLFSTDATPTVDDDITFSQKRLSEVTEMIHTASLLHDDVIDEAMTRRGVPSINAMFGNKFAILGGDFLLARASVALSRLRNADVVELLSVVLEHLAKGEVLQMSAADRRTSFLAQIDYYLTKSYYKTASLFSNGCKAAAILGGHTPAIQEVLFEYGRYLGLTFQIVDDLLDFVGTDESLGKPAHADLGQGIATLPVLYAAEQFPELSELIARKFKQSGDVEQALRFVDRSNSMERARQLAIDYAGNAVAAALQLPDSPARSGLISLVDRVLNRER